jgi:hypothetical protein
MVLIGLGQNFVRPHRPGPRSFEPGNKKRKSPSLAYFSYVAVGRDPIGRAFSSGMVRDPQGNYSQGLDRMVNFPECDLCATTRPELQGKKIKTSQHIHP